MSKAGVYFDSLFHSYQKQMFALTACLTAIPIGNFIALKMLFTCVSYKTLNICETYSKSDSRIVPGEVLVLSKAMSHVC